jgi:putative ABC transport system substrate-binding protein
MKRRTLLKGMVAAAASPMAALAQAKSPVIGVLVPGNVDPSGLLNTFREAMRGLGYVEGQNFQIEFRAGDGEPLSLSRLANDLVSHKVDIIVAWLTPAVRAAKQATSDIPIVIAGAGDPVATGLVASLGRPGGNITGMAAVTPELAGKNIELIRELLPAARKLGAMCNETDAFTKVFLEQIRIATTREKFDLDVVMTTVRDFETGFRRIHDNGADAVIVQPSLPTQLVARLALEARLPAICPLESFTRAGGLLGYAGRSTDQFRLAADYVDKILKGSKPADLPIQLPTQFDLSINLKTAHALGLTVPPSMLARASDVVE